MIKMNKNEYQKIQFIDNIYKLSPEIKNKINEKMSEKHRFYHNVFHINLMLNVFTQFYQSQCNKDEQKKIYLAILFHDIIYDTNPQSKNENEIKSALFFENIMQFQEDLSEEDIHEISNIIKSTHYDYEKTNTKLNQMIKEIDHFNFVLGLEYIEKSYKDLQNEFSDYYSKKQILKNSILFYEKLLNIKLFNNDNFENSKNENLKKAIIKLTHKSFF